VFSSISKRFSYANVVATLALVFAMSGGALAATHYLVTSTKQIKPNVLAQLKGKNGANGINGVNGTSGKDGAQGPAGEKGPAGTNGTNGANGTQGSAGPTGPKGAAGGKGENGENGVTGPAGASGATGSTGATGQPWTPNNTLPSGATETGTWSWSDDPASVPDVKNPAFVISFPIPLSEEINFPATEEVKGKFVNENFVEPGESLSNKPSTGCRGSAAKPEALPGNLCIFATHNGAEGEDHLIFFGSAPPTAGSNAVGETGALLSYADVQANTLETAYGTWAVTAP
jgi:hypothetical protein